MQPKAPERTRLIVISCLAILLIAGGTRSAVAGGEYLLDIKGTVEIVGEPSPSKSAGSGREVHYWVCFQYREPGVEGPSFLDRPAQVEDGRFEVEGLQPDKVYRVFVQRVIVDPSLPGGGSREEMPLYVPSDFWKTVEVGPQAPPADPLRIELAVAGPEGSDEPPRSLSLQYHGKEVRLAAFTGGPGVS